MRREFILPLSYRSWATRLALAFVFWSAVWVVSSDYLLHLLLGSAVDFWLLETEKGLIYVGVSGILLWQSVRAMERDEAAQRAANESKLRSLKESGLIGVSGWSPAGKLRYVNETLAQMLGRAQQEIVGTDARRYIASEFVELYRRSDLELHLCGRTSIHELQLLRKDGVRVPVLAGRALVEGDEGGGIGYFLDISELKTSEEHRKLMEEELLHAERLIALGRLAGGIAHDFNNQLAVIISYASLLQARPNLDPFYRQNVEQIFRAADRARSLIRQLLAFSRKQVLRPTILDLNAVLTETRPILERLLPENIELVLKLSPEQQLIEIDEAQFEQVLLNLVVNARDAMPDGGSLTLKLSASTIEEVPDEQTGESMEQVVLEISDTGLGMEESVKQHIFEPFFTTKQYRGGTGLGLATVYGIIKQSGGDISVESAVGRGTTFKVMLPRVQNTLEPKVRPTSQAERQLLAGTVLLVEDLEDLRTATAQILASSGLKVIEARDGVEAVERAKGNPAIDLIVSDVSMPRLSGPEAVRKIRESHPEVKVIFLSGYADSDMTKETDLVLAKPVTVEFLLATIRSLLESDRSEKMRASEPKNSAA